MQNLFGSSRYLTKDDVGDGFVFTISGIQSENIGQQGRAVENGNVLYFMEAKKGMVLKPTNAKTIAKLTGIMDPRAIEQGAWNGYQVTLYNNPDIVFGNEVTGGIRVREVRAGDQPYYEENVAQPQQFHQPAQPQRQQFQQPAPFRPDPRQGPDPRYQHQNVAGPAAHRPQPAAQVPQQQFRQPAQPTHAPQQQFRPPPPPPRPPGAPIHQVPQQQPVYPTQESFDQQDEVPFGPGPDNEGRM